MVLIIIIDSTISSKPSQYSKYCLALMKCIKCIKSMIGDWIDMKASSNVHSFVDDTLYAVA